MLIVFTLLKNIQFKRHFLGPLKTTPGSAESSSWFLWKHGLYALSKLSNKHMPSCGSLILTVEIKDKTSAVKHCDKNCYHKDNTAFPSVTSSCHIQEHV